MMRQAIWILDMFVTSTIPVQGNAVYILRHGAKRLTGSAIFYMSFAGLIRPQSCWIPTETFFPAHLKYIVCNTDALAHDKKNPKGLIVR